MTIHSFPVKDNTKKESLLSEPSSKQTHTLSNYLTGQLPTIELPLHSAPSLVTLASTSTSEILKEYFGGERPSTPPQDTSDPRVFSRTNSSAVSSTHSLQTNDSGYVSTSQSKSVMTSVIQNQSRDQIRKELNQNYDFLITLREAEKDKPEAQFHLGLMYQRGLGVDQNHTQAVYWFRKAAAQGHAGVQCNFGVMYARGEGVKQDDAQAVYWYRKAAEQGHPYAQCNLGCMYELGRGVEQDSAQAFDWYRKAAAQGHAGAQCNLGLMYERGLGVKQDDAQAMDWYGKAAKQGHPDAQFNLGLIYERGLGVEKDNTQAMNWYSKAAEQGNASAQFSLGLIYDRGLGVKQDDAQAVYWYRKAAEQGDPDAQFNLGWMYDRGLGVKQDDAQAVYWYRKAAEQGHPDAQCNLGVMYESGLGVKEDQAQAVVWYLKAAEQGNASAQFSLGLMYQRGLGVKQDYNQALIWFRKAAEQGHAVAQYNIGKLYAKGKGVEANDVEAFNWYLKAAKNGSKDAQLKLASVYQQGRGVEKDVLQATYWLLRWAVEDARDEISLDAGWVAEGFYSDIIQCIPAALTTFPEFKCIKTIHFEDVELSGQDFLSIGQMIRANPNLKGLSFGCQEIDDAQALILSQSLAFNTTLTEIIFDDEYGFDTTIFDQIKASLAQNVIIAELRERLKGHLITGPNGLPIRVPYITRSDELPLEVLEIIVDNMIVEASKVGEDKKAIIAGIDEFLLSVSRETLKNDLKKSS
jgi:TPR repeat protein